MRHQQGRCAGLPIRWSAKNVGWRGADFLRTPPWALMGGGAAHTHPPTSPTQFQEINGTLQKPPN